ncbi:putative E3 ubiquitin-protein ligase mug30 [Pseudocercospora fuligena]|uniref:HECT-type E3 ubiquitin transferase n=1 Tax=Pseudocercospora fuligena TaxID=685502 RepID=A0A8H6RBH6_9PEZI|nr:putative E3 ubiquitin-protein ligase mug30 [Pseudocercospora fuligena]
MPSSWSSRLLSSGSGSSAPSSAPVNSNNSTTNRNKTRPRPPNDYLDPPTLNPERLAASPTKPRANGTRQHAHSRSISHPLPKIFGRKKSTNFNDADAALDDGLVPVLDDGPAQSAPTRVLSGKKGKLDEDSKAARRCMCCDNKVNVPRDLVTFRCIACLTINDLKPVEEQEQAEKDRPQVKRADTYPGNAHQAGKLPISVERTRAIIDKCIVTYLESRCRKPDEPASRTLPTPKEDVFGPDQLPAAMGAIDLKTATTAQELTEEAISTSPTDAPKAQAAFLAPSAAIREQTDFSPFSGTRLDTPLITGSSAGDEPAHPGSVSRKPVPVPARPSRKPPPPPMSFPNRRPSHNLLPPPNGSLRSNGHMSPRHQPSPRATAEEIEQRRRYDRVKTIFRPLEDYMSANYGNFLCLNSSFSTVRPAMKGRARSASDIATPPPEPAADTKPSPVGGLSELDAKTLLLGDIGENGTWWTGKLDRSDKAIRRKKVGEGPRRAVASKSPNINWREVSSWYELVHSAGEDWKSKVQSIDSDEAGFVKDNILGDANADMIDDDIAEAREHAIRALLKITENILKRPTRPLKEPDDLRWLLIILMNPSLYPSTKPKRTKSGRNTFLGQVATGQQNGSVQASPMRPTPGKSPGHVGSQHNGLLKRIFGLLSGTPENCHWYLAGWFSRYSEDQFVKTIDLVASFVNYRIDRRNGRPRRTSAVVDGGLIPDLTGGAMNTSAQLHAAMGLSGSVKKSKDDASGEPDWADDWQTKVAASVMSMLFTANNIWQGKRRQTDEARVDSLVAGSNLSPSAKAKRSGQLLHTSSFYNTLLDYHDMIADFRVWETRREKFAFCKYPLFISIGTKIKILEHDARRQMEVKAREAYLDQVLHNRTIDGHFHLRVRRECMVDDSLRQISEAVGSGQEELKKGLRVHFTDEEGVDAGGPRKEWFLMLVRDIFDPNHGMFVYDDESNTCYFNPNSFETSDQYFLVGALLGLAIYNSTILDVALPPFAFRKLLAAAPSSVTSAANTNVSSLTGTKGQMTYTLNDLAEFRPSLAAGLQKLLDFDGDVEATYCRDFVASIERYGVTTDVPLKPNGAKIPVTNANRQEFVDAYVRYMLDTAVTRQFEPFKRGFFQVCQGNALSLFRAEEIELLVRGSDESLDVDSLRAVAQYENWRHFQPPHQAIQKPAESVPVIAWFWELFAEASPEKQRKLLTFITGTDRIPAVGATSLILRIQAGGDGWGGGGLDERSRFPVARTCFNMLVLWRYDYREQLEEKLWRAVDESEGFGLK